MPFFFFDPSMILLIPALILTLYAQRKVKTTFAKYTRVQARVGKSGAQVARELLDQAGLRDVPVEPIQQQLGDHYDPRSRKMRLSPDVYRGGSLAALAVAAHETGHAIQHAQGYVPLNIRNSMFPVANFGSRMAMPLFLIGFFFAVDGGGGIDLMLIGIWLFTAALAFQIVTLPVEFNASSRAMTLLSDGGYLAEGEQSKAKAVLDAAALTYVAAAAVALMHLLRLIILRGMRR